MARVFPHELVGKEIEIVESSNSNQKGLKGKVVDETRNTIRIEAGGKTITLLKGTVKFRIGKDVVSGRSIIKRPEDRIKGK